MLRWLKTVVVSDSEKAGLDPVTARSPISWLALSRELRLLSYLTRSSTRVDESDAGGRKIAAAVRKGWPRAGSRRRHRDRLAKTATGSPGSRACLACQRLHRVG